MAKGNLFQGMARGKVGDVVFYRYDGDQVARVRNRKPANPRSAAQMYQRAIIATVMRAYSAGKDIFDHSFEGKKVGLGCQRQFLSRNAAALRQALKYDLEVQPTQHITAVLNAPKTTYPVPNTYIVSEGSLDGGLFQITDPTAGNVNSIVSTPAVAEGGETLQQYAERVGLRVGDIYTFVGFTSNTQRTVYSVQNGIGAGAYQEMGRFFFCRLIVTDAINSDVPADDALLNTIFEIDETNNIGNLVGLESAVAGAAVAADSFFTFTDTGEEIAAMGVIRSAVDSPLRSTETLHWAKWNNVTGIDWMNVLGAWMKEKDSLGGSELILEGAMDKYLSEGGDPNILTGLLTIGNFVGVKTDAGTTMILRNGSSNIVASSGGIHMQVGDDNATITLLNKNEYSGSLEQIDARFEMTEGEDGAQSTSLGYVVITIGSQKFQTREKVSVSQRSTGTVVPLSDFVKA